jgi:hypothetical protein
MRPMVVLALIAGVIAPPVPWTAAPEAAPKAAASALAAPASPACALVRNAAKAEKTFSTDWAAAVDCQPRHPASAVATARIDAATSPSHLDLDSPPLAPRPPPLS